MTRNFHVRFVWEYQETFQTATGYSSYDVVADDSKEAEQRAKKRASKDFPNYTCRDFNAQEN